MRVLVTWGSKHGGTEGLARVVGDTLLERGFDVDMMDAQTALKAKHFDAVVVGGALYANRWHAAARRFVRRREKDLRRVPVWFFSSGPLDTSADHAEIPPTRQVQALMERVGAQGHVTFGGRLLPGTSAVMPKKLVGDWRDPYRVRAWSIRVVESLPNARPNPPVPQPGRSLVPLALHGVAGWAVCAGLMLALLATVSEGLAVALHAVAAPLVFAGLAVHYFRLRGAREPLTAAFTFAGMVALLDGVVVAALVQRSGALLLSLPGFWLPLALIFFATWGVGVLRSMQPFSRPPQATA